MEMFRGGSKGVLAGLEGLASRRSAWVVLAAGILLAGLALALVPGATVDTSTTASLPDSAESTRALEAQQQLPATKYAPALAVYTRADGSALTSADRQAVTAKVQDLAPLAATGQKVFPGFAEDGEAALVGVPLSTGLSVDAQSEKVGDLRKAAAADLPDGLRVSVTGAPAFRSDLASVFDGANFTLLGTTAAVVALLLLITYRSPWLWLVPLTVVGVADQVATKLVSLAVSGFGFTIDNSTIGITSVLVFGAGTNYALLLIARYREELRREEDRYAAMRVALGRAAPAILASSSTVVLSLLALGLASAPTNRGLGFASAIGIVTAVLFALLVLPAALLVFGRGLFWPFVPRVGQDDPTRDGPWAKVGGFVTRRPVPVAAVSVVVLAILGLGAVGLQTGLSQTEQFREKPESVTGQTVLAEHFAAGASEPTTVITTPGSASTVARAVSSVEGVSSVEEGPSDASATQLDVVLGADPASAQARELVGDVRAAAHEADRGSLVGGADAQATDERAAAVRDLVVIVPVILAVVLLVLLLLLRSVVAAVVLVLTVVATFGASLGAGWWAFQHVFDFPALGLQVPLYSFLFLVALGVDYNIFLATRAREEAATSDTRTAIAAALASTGGVITSAGILLAAVFTVLGVLPLILLTQIGIIVGFGVLLDTLLVRSLLVPALVTLLGDRFWWPGLSSARRDPDGSRAGRRARASSPRPS